jgi:hypothetical protein
MMYPYAFFLLDFEKKHASHVHCNKPENTRAAFVIETRPDFFLPMVLKNVSFFLGEHWNIYLLCGEMSEAWVKNITQGWNIGIQKLKGCAKLSIKEYSSMLMSRKFWDAFPEEKILVFQSDIILCGPKIDEFIRYDYIGAPVRYRDRSDAIVFNGGLSLRSKSKLVQCLETFGPDFSKPEDVYYSETLPKVDAILPDYDTASRFCLESDYSYQGLPFGVHGTNKYYHSPETACEIIGKIKY